MSRGEASPLIMTIQSKCLARIIDGYVCSQREDRRFAHADPYAHEVCLFFRGKEQMMRQGAARRGV